MAKWERSSAELVARFDACLPEDEDVQRRQIFGCPCAFVNGHMFAGLHEQRLIVRLDEGDRAALARTVNAGPFVVMGRTMREYVAVAQPLDHPPRALAGWLSKALAYARTLPPKKPKKAAQR